MTEETYLERPLPVEPSPKKFWMIVREPSGKYTEAPNPRAVYRSERAARNDAEELAKKEGRRFFILAAIDSCAPSKPPIEWTAPG